MFRQKNCIVYGTNSKGGGQKFYLSQYPTTKTPYTWELDEAKVMPYDVANSQAKVHGLYVESR